jgi:DNA-binding transcriptional ArsR family regulator
MEQFERLQQYFQILSDVNRLRIIKFIGREERTVSEIVNAMKLSQPLVSHHLKTLKNSGILDTKRAGPFIYYKLKDARFLDILGLFEEILPKEGIPNAVPMFYCPDWCKKFNW